MSQVVLPNATQEWRYLVRPSPSLGTSTHASRPCHVVITDGYYSKRKFLDGVRALGMHQIGKLRHDANLRYLYQGPGRPGPGRPKLYDGKSLPLRQAQGRH